MTDGWYGPAVDDHAATDAGTFLGPVTIGVLHTTESPRGKYRSGGPRNYGNFGHTSFPHFTVDVQGGKFVAFQHISIRHAAKALRNTSGGVQTNREGVIQIEVVGSATQPLTSDPVMVEGLSALMRWIESQTQIPAASGVTWKAYPASYGNNGVRLSNAAWEGYAGWLGHQHVPENTHGDPGAITISALLPAPAVKVAAQAKTAAKVVVAKARRKDPVLRQGDKGQAVKNVQAALVKDGYHLKVDGDFGPATKKAVIAFQRKHRLTADGVVGPKTWAALRVVAHGK